VHDTNITNGDEGTDTLSNIEALRFNKIKVASEASEFRVNTYTDGRQWISSIAALTNGGFVVSWESISQDGSGHGIYAQRYDANGVAQGSEFQVNTYTNSSQWISSIAALTNGGFVVTWTSDNQDDNYTHGVFGQRYDVNGVTQSSEFKVNTYTAGSQEWSSIAGLTNGSFVVTWTSDNQDGSSSGIFGQRYNVNGVAQGSEFKVNTYTNNHQVDSSIAALTNGGFVVTWTSNGQDGSGYGVFGQRYDVNGVAQGSEFRVNTSTGGNQDGSSIAALTNGGFVVTWNSGNDIFGKRFDGNGVAQGSEFKVATGNDPSIAGLVDGGFLVTWNSWGGDGDSYSIYGQRYDVNGVAKGSEFQVNNYTIKSQIDSSITALTDGGFVVSWSSDGQDGGGSYVLTSGYGVYARRYNADGVPVEIKVEQTPIHASELTNTAVTLPNGKVNTNYTIPVADLLTSWTDADGDTLSIISLTANHGAVIDIGNNGTYTVLHPAETYYSGLVTLSYGVSDGTLASQATLGFDLIATNAAPVDGSDTGGGSTPPENTSPVSGGNTPPPTTESNPKDGNNGDNIPGSHLNNSEGGSLPPPNTIPPSIVGGNTLPSTTPPQVENTNVSTVIESDGSTTIVVPVFTPGKSTALPSDHADIPILVNASNDQLLTANLPVGFGLHVNGQAHALGSADAGIDLVQRIKQQFGTDNNQVGELIVQSQNFIASLGSGETFFVQTIELTADGNTTPNAPIIITGSDSGDSKQMMIIDVSQLPTGTIIQLNNVAFASIVGATKVIGGKGENFAVGDADVQFMVLGADDDILFGGGGNDTIGSLSGDDQTSGDAGDDVVYGGTGDDQLNGGAGSDQLNGGLGFDRATQAGLLSDYQVSVQGNTITLKQGNGETDTLTDVELIHFSSDPSLAVAYSDIEAVAHHLAKTWLGRDLTATEGSAVQSWKDATTDNILAAFYSLPEAAGLQDKTPGELLADLETNPYIIRLNVVRELMGSDDNDQGYLPLGLALNANGGEGYDVLRMTGNREDVHLEFASDSLELTRLSDGAMLSLKNAEAIAFDSGETVIVAHNAAEATLARLVHSFFNRDATSEEWQLGQEALDAQVSFDVILGWFKQNADLDGLSDTDYIQTIYTQTLGRLATNDEFNQQLARLENDQVSREWLTYEVAESSEAATHLIGSVLQQDGWV
jgi:hypothetical protein